MEDPYACAVCFRRLSQPIVLNCGHTFHRACVEELTTCPLCRAEILTRSTNWQLISLIEAKNKESASSKDPSSDEVDLEDKYISVGDGDWSTLPRGTMIRYSLNVKKPTYRYGWFRSFDLEKQVVQIYFNRGKIVKLPLEYIKEASYHPDLLKDTIEYEVVCCNLL